MKNVPHELGDSGGVMSSRESRDIPVVRERGGGGRGAVAPSCEGCRERHAQFTLQWMAGVGRILEGIKNGAVLLTHVEYDKAV